jgi:hypothetical protein
MLHFSNGLAMQKLHDYCKRYNKGLAGAEI